jgi:phosphotransferase system enzyme I (PtsI)
MIESPAGAVLAEEILDEADFVSVGTNDLTMYTLAVDRDGVHLASFFDPFHPAFVRTLHGVIRAGQAADKPVSVCGEVASDPTWTGLLVGMGLTRFSMAAQWILPVGHVVATIDGRFWEGVAAEVLAMPSAEQIRRRIRELIPA